MYSNLLFHTLSRISPKRPYCLDIETTGLDRHRDSITSIQVGYFDKETLKGKAEYFSTEDYSERELTTFLRGLKQFKKLITHNGKFDLLFLLEKYGVELELWVDTLVLAHVCGEEEMSLKVLVKKYYNDDYDIKVAKKKGAKSEEVIVYGKKDVYYPIKLFKLFKAKVEKYNLSKVFHHEMRAYKAYYKVEQTGVPVSPRRYAVKKQLQNEYTPLLNKLNEVAKINWGSTQQVGNVLYTNKGKPVYASANQWIITTEDKEVLATGFKTKKVAVEYAETLDIPVVCVRTKANNDYIVGYGLGYEPKKFTDKGKPSTDKDALSDFIGDDLIDTLLEYQRLTKLETFVDSWEELQVDGRIYPSFNITARTGRTTCSNPNLENAVGSLNSVNSWKPSKLYGVIMSQAC